MNFYSRSSGSGATGQNVGALLKVRNPRVGSLAPKLQRYGEVVKYPLIDLSFGLQHRFDPKIRLVDEHPTQKFIVNGLLHPAKRKKNLCMQTFFVCQELDEKMR